MYQVEQDISGLMEVDENLAKRRAARALGFLWGISRKQCKRRKRRKRLKIMVMVLALFASILCMMCYLARCTIPESIYLFREESSKLSFSVPIPVIGVIVSVQNSGISDIPAEKLSIHFSQDVTMRGAVEEGEVNVALKLFGLLPIGSMDVKTIEKTKVIPVGIPIGVYLKDTGVLVVGTGAFTDENGVEAEPCSKLLYSGEYIVAVNGCSVTKKSEIADYVEHSRGQELTFTVKNDTGNRDVTVRPLPDASGQYKLGLWLRDNAQGIGTMTYLEENGNFAAFGHGLSDVDTKELIEMAGGSAYETEIVKIQKGVKGNPGELTGRIAYEEDNCIATVNYNLNSGIYGTVNKESAFAALYEQGTPVEVALKQEVALGKAYIMSCLDQSIHYYEIEITKLQMNDKKQGRGITFTVTDKDLIEKTGGIVQGMSGSPILQNGKLVGAVTHVFVEEPTKGYAIFAETMLTEEKSVQ